MTGFSKTKLRSLIKEELATAKEYDAKGYHSAAKDERKHAFFFKMQLKRK